MSEQAHLANLETQLFGGSRQKTPPWLSASVARCKERYGALALTEQFRAAIESFGQDGTQRPFEVFVVGEGKFGKSTLVNCLLGEELSQVRILPETRFFLRYALTHNPTKKVRFFVRMVAGEHNWLIKELGRGVRVPDLYETTEHVVDLARAKRLVQRELMLMNAGGYDPAILEVEREVAISELSAFQSEVRLVDTQGLDQLFPDELLKAGLSASDDPSTVKRFHDWLKSTPRGKHLEWQFRRCDAVLWCVSAKRIGSAATRASLAYFGEYSKKTVLALTNVDLVVGSDSRNMQRLLADAAKKYGGLVSRICPVNGKMAWEHISEGMCAPIESGFPELETALHDTFIERADVVRNRAKYCGLRKTERQYRLALRGLAASYRSLITKFESDVARVIAARDKEVHVMATLLHQMFVREHHSISSRIQLIGMREDSSSARRLMSVESHLDRISYEMRDQIVRVVQGQIKLLSEQVGHYSLPVFDADGNIAGNRIRVDVEVIRSSFAAAPANVFFSLDDLVWGDLWITIKGFVDKQKAEAERAAVIAERQHSVRKAFDAGWSESFSATLELLVEEIQVSFDKLIEEVVSVYRRIEREVGAPLNVAEGKIMRALNELAVLPAISSNLLRAFSHGFGTQLR